MLAAYVTVGPVSWTLKAGTHTMPSRSEGGAPSFIFSMVNEKNPEVFYAVVLDKGAPIRLRVYYFRSVFAVLLPRCAFAARRAACRAPGGRAPAFCRRAPARGG